MAHIEIRGDTRPVLLVLKLAAQSGKVPFELGDLPEEIVRTKTVYDPAGTGVAVVHFYPSDALLDLLVASVAVDFDFRIVE